MENVDVFCNRGSTLRLPYACLVPAYLVYNVLLGDVMVEEEPGREGAVYGPCVCGRLRRRLVTPSLGLWGCAGLGLGVWGEGYWARVRVRVRVRVRIRVRLRVRVRVRVRARARVRARGCGAAFAAGLKRLEKKPERLLCVMRRVRVMCAECSCVGL